jgi:uncharacterized membrane protein YesL
MGGIGRVFRWALRTWWDEMSLLALGGIVGSIIALPFAIVAMAAFELTGLPLIIALVFFVPFIPNPGWVGLAGLSNRLVQFEGVKWQNYLDTVRRYWLHSTILYAISLVGTLLIMQGMRFYITSENVILQVIGVIMLYFLVLWFIIQLYLQPILLEQDRPNILRAYRFAALVALAKPLVSLGMLLICSVFLGVGWFTLIGVPLVVIPFFAVISACALYYAVNGKVNTLD